MPNEIRRPSLEGKGEGREGLEGQKTPSQSSKFWFTSDALSSRSHSKGQESPGSMTYKPKDSTVRGTVIVSTQEYTPEVQEAIKNYKEVIGINKIDTDKKEQLGKDREIELAYDEVHIVSTSHHFDIENEIHVWKDSKTKRDAIDDMVQKQKSRIEKMFVEQASENREARLHKVENMNEIKDRWKKSNSRWEREAKDLREEREAFDQLAP